MPKSTNNNGLRDAPSLYSFVQTTETNPQNPYFMNFFFKYTFEYVLQQRQKRRLYKEPAIYPKRAGNEIYTTLKL